MRRAPAQDYARKRSSLIALLVMGVFLAGLSAGFGWSLDRQLRGGVLRQREEAMRRPDWVHIDRLPAHVPAAFLAVADPDFLARSALAIGAQQPTLGRDLAGQVHLLPTDTWGRAQALVMGPLLEQRLSKRALLELYLNRIALGRAEGGEVYGLTHAARDHFGKEPAALTLGEAATLAGLLLPPRLREPARKPGAAGIRRNEVLRLMLQSGALDEEAYRAAITEPLGFQPGVAEAPMSRPLDWNRPVPELRLPEPLRPRPDSTAAADSAR